MTAPEQVKDLLRGLKTPQMIKICARWRIGVGGAPAAGAAKRALRALARRHQALTAEIDELDAELLALCEQANPALLGACGVGAETAAALLTAAGDNPERMRSEAAFAALCGASPIEASSGPRTPPPAQPRRQPPSQQGPVAHRHGAAARPPTKHRLRRAPPRPGQHPAAETIRCLKRHIAREIYRLLTDPPQVPHGADLRRHRNQHGLTLDAAAQALHTHTTRISALERGLYHNRDLAERYQQHLVQITT